MKVVSRFFVVLLFVSVCLFSVINQATAGIARVESMGMQADSYWAIQKDEAYIYYNPASLSKFTPQIYADPVNEIGGLILNPANNFNLYLLTGRPLDYLSYPGYLNNYPFRQDTPANAPLTKEQFNADASINFGNAAIGFHTSYSMSSDVDDTANDDFSRSVLTLGAGFLMDFGHGMDLDATLGIAKWKIDQEVGGATAYSASTFDIKAAGRLNMAISEVSKLHIFGILQRLDRSDTLGAASESSDKYTTLMMGVSDEMNITKSSLVYFGTGIGYVKEKLTGGSITDKYLKVFAGVETNVFESLSARFGFNRFWYDSEKTDVSESNTEDTNPRISFGLGWKLGNVTLDWQIAENLVKDGPYFISGAGSTSTQFEARYTFETPTTAPAVRK